jgi:hypothetical protein
MGSNSIEVVNDEPTDEPTPREPGQGKVNQRAK